MQAEYLLRNICNVCRDTVSINSVYKLLFVYNLPLIYHNVPLIVEPTTVFSYAIISRFLIDSIIYPSLPRIERYFFTHVAMPRVSRDFSGHTDERNVTTVHRSCIFLSVSF